MEFMSNILMMADANKKDSVFQFAVYAVSICSAYTKEHCMLCIGVVITGTYKL